MRFQDGSNNMCYRQVAAEYQRMAQLGSEYDRKQVYQIRCRHCSASLTNRGMNAVLLSDRTVQLFSTDLVPNTVGFVQGDYSAASCTCRVRDTACLSCGNVVGYHVNVPCKVCLGQPNNGHYWMFRSADIKASQIYARVGDMQPDLPLLWGFVHGAGDFVGGYHRTGDHLAAYESCRLSVHLPASIHLITHHPHHSFVNARTPDEHLFDEYIEMCR
ncbi:protein fam72a [Lichtheimia corymbifera JMRC:FSU:9682]|uniref:Protein fam72a n=1 Tax=Lichtheimia corymbifera JMRC:FSU:9682 TaxID=1263082 RepID=A0A068S0U2_9FUNG|nr:protein fam72a [Lichtheimia corymbifera JMRC:FSU:9682]